jgi:hypothetical protein
MPATRSVANIENYALFFWNVGSKSRRLDSAILAELKSPENKGFYGPGANRPETTRAR